jgi:carbon monoxide dehydrogenase subunit G
MEHEVFVPVPVERLRAALSDPERVARAVPGLQQDAGTAPVAGRLKVRVGGHSITYRGALRVAGQDDGSCAIEGDATEARGSGSVKLALSVRLLPAEGGTTVAFGGTATADGRIAELPPEAVTSATTRLLNRFAENLGEAAEEAEEKPPPEPQPEAAPAAEAETEPEPEQELEAAPEAEQPYPTSAFDTDVPPPLDAEDLDDLDAEDDFGQEAPEELEEPEDLPSEDFADEGEPPAEAAHARRTMIGRSAEEVDHAPPRGRYAPVPPPELAMPSRTVRWAAPAAALALASVVLAARALRKRRG